MSHTSKVPGTRLIFCIISKRTNTTANTQSHVLCMVRNYGRGLHNSIVGYLLVQVWLCSGYGTRR